jgi:DNA-binding transcriptional LysR family regulator
VDLKGLRYFRAIAERGTFSKAAAHLRVAQPALSRQIQKLEHDLGVQLLQRTARGVMPTEAGRLLLDRTRQLEQGLEENAPRTGALRRSPHRGPSSCRAVTAVADHGAAIAPCAPRRPPRRRA